MDFPQTDTQNDLEDARHLLVETKAALEKLSQQVSQPGLNPHSLNGEIQDIIAQTRLTLEQAGKCLEAEALKRESEQIYSAIFANSPYALSLTRMPDGILVDVNDAFLSLFGFSRGDVIGKTSPELKITDEESRLQVAQEMQKHGIVKDFVCSRATRSGELLWLSLCLDWVTIGGEKFILTTIRDVTVERQSGLAIEKTTLAAENERKRLLAVMEALPVGVAILDAKGGTIQSNRAFEEIWGAPLPPTNEVNDYGSYKAWWLDSDQPVKPGDWASAQAIQRGKPITGQVMKIQKFDGALAYVHNSAAPILDQQGKVTGCAVAIQDISQVKFREAEIKQLNRTLKALSNSNQAMMRARSEQAFLDEACRIIIDDCGFAMVWIGYAENDKKKSVRPVASAGFEQGYLDQLNITWANSARGRGPTGTAIRTKKPSRCNNMLTDPKFAPWREAAVERGYASSIVLPLIANDRSFGALNIYSREPEGFSDEEEKLLVELAGDLAYGITNLRLRAERELSEQALHLSEERYRTIVETSSEGIILATPQGVFTYVNRRMAEMLGYPEGEILGKSSLEFAYPGVDQQVGSARKMLATGEPLHGEFKFRRKDGSVLWTLYNASPIYNEKGEHVANLALHTDITERKRLEERLIYLASFPEMNPRPIIEVDLAGNVQYSNPTALQKFPDIGEKKLNHPYLAGWEVVLDALRHETSGNFTRDVIVGDRYYEQSFNMLPNKTLVRVYAMDITERKLATQALLDAHNELEQRVLTRTEELNIAVQQLRTEIDARQSTQVELESSLQELQVIEEELRNNNEMLIDAQKVLDDERIRFQDLFDYAPDGNLVTDSFGAILEANQNACKMLNMAHKHLVGKPLIVFIAPIDHAQFKDLLIRLQHHSEAQSYELRILSRRGEEITTAVTVGSAKDRNGNAVLRWSLRDITERKRAEEIIQQNSLRNEVLSELSQSLAEASLDEKAVLQIVCRTSATRIGDSCVINLVSEDGRWLDPVAWYHKQPEIHAIMTSIFEASHHPSSDGLSGRVFQSSKPMLIDKFDLKSAAVSPEIRTYIEQIGIGSLMAAPLMIGTKKLGTISMIRGNNGRPYTADDQALLEIIAYRTAQTIHNARLYEELQDALRKELETHEQLVQTEKFAAVGRLLASITHEINNPLQTIKNCLYLSQIDTPPGTAAFDALTMATAETNRLSNLVAQLREIYRPPTTGLHKPVNIPVLLSEVQLLVAGYLQDKHVAWELNPESTHLFDHLVIDGVADQLKQVFLNIALNSIDAMEPDGGKIMIDLKISADEPLAGISFRDTGPGLSAEIKEKLFEPFVTTKEKGLGLGLVICYDIIQKHQGRLEADSQPGEGAAFTVWLPYKKGSV